MTEITRLNINDRDHWSGSIGQDHWLSGGALLTVPSMANTGAIVSSEF